MRASDFQITGLSDWVAARLAERAVFRGLTVLRDNRGSLLDDLDKAIGALGTVAVVGNSDGDNPNKRSSTSQSTTRVDVVLGESDIVNQNRVLLADPVANDAARRALTTIATGQRVRQSGASQDFMIEEAWDYWLCGTTPANPAHWSPLWDIEQIVELVKRVLDGQQPSAGAVLRYDSHAFGVPFLSKAVAPDKTAVVRFETVLEFPHFFIP